MAIMNWETLYFTFETSGINYKVVAWWKKEKQIKIERKSKYGNLTIYSCLVFLLAESYF